MYSPPFQCQEQQAVYYYDNTSYQQHSLVDARRVSYTDYLSGQSEGSTSDYEQSTPSPLNVYEEYTAYNKNIKDKYPMPCHYMQQQHPYHHHQQQQHHHHHHHPFSFVAPLYHDPTAATANTTSTQMMLPMPVPQSQSLTPFYYPSATPMLDVPSAVNPFEYPTTSVTPYMSTTDDALHHLSKYHCHIKQEEKYHVSDAFSTPNLEKDEQASFRSSSISESSSSRSSSPDMPKSEVPLKSSCRHKVTKPRSKRGDASVQKKPSSVSNSDSIDMKTFPCEYGQCDKSFKRSEHLKRHIRSIHTKEKPYHCPYNSCGKRFARSDNLSQHIRIHRPNKEKPSRARKVADL